MIKFFRQIRYRLISNEKSGKYLKYAIGEIVLVVIGILIALQINTWNEARKLNRSELALLKGLQKEFNKNIEDLNSSIKFNTDNIHASMSVTDLIRKELLEEQHKPLDSLLGLLGLIASFDANTGMTDQIISSGQLGILKNEVLREKLTNWLAEVRNQKQEISFAVDNYNFNLIPYLIKHFPLANAELYKFDFDPQIPIYKEPSSFKANLSKIDIMEFENIIWHHKHNIDFVVSADLDLLDSATEINEIILSELNTKSE